MSGPANAAAGARLGRPGFADGRASGRARDWTRYVAGAAALYCAVTLATQGGWLASGAMWAEMASNYYPNAASPDWAVKLLSTDAGYFPAPQRLVALAGDLAGVPAPAVPYLYGAAAVLLGGLMVAAFCHPAFRPLVADDRVRFVLCAGFCLIPDFETRVFINFTYLGLLVTAPLVAVSMVRGAADAPGWAWAMPLLMLSKPVHLALVPVMLLAALVAKPRYRLIFAASALAAGAQVVRLVLSSRGGADPGYVDAGASLAGKLATALASGAAMLADFTLGPVLGLALGRATPWLVVAVGAALTLALAVLVVRRRARPGAALVLVGVSLVYGVAFLNSFALSRYWTLDLAFTQSFATYRWTIGAIIGALFAAVGALQLVLGGSGPPGRRRIAATPFTVALAWLVLSGWPAVVLRARAQPFPQSGASYWADLSERIGRRAGPLCVPADPYVWQAPLFMYRDRCVQLTNGPAADAPAEVVGEGTRTPVPAGLRARAIVGLIVVVRPGGAGPAVIDVRASAEAAGGGRVAFAGRRRVDPAGGLVLLLPPEGAVPVPLASLGLETSPAVPVLQGDGGGPAVIYLGLDE